MFLTDELSFDALREDCEVIDLEGRSVKIASVSKLLELKESIDPLREKDRADIDFLKRLLNNE